MFKFSLNGVWNGNHFDLIFSYRTTHRQSIRPIIISVTNRKKNNSNKHLCSLGIVAFCIYLRYKNCIATSFIALAKHCNDVDLHTKQNKRKKIKTNRKKIAKKYTHLTFGARTAVHIAHLCTAKSDITFIITYIFYIHIKCRICMPFAL